MVKQRQEQISSPNPKFWPRPLLYYYQWHFQTTRPSSFWYTLSKGRGLLSLVYFSKSNSYAEPSHKKKFLIFISAAESCNDVHHVPHYSVVLTQLYLSNGLNGVWKRQSTRIGAAALQTICPFISAQKLLSRSFSTNKETMLTVITPSASRSNCKTCYIVIENKLGILKMPSIFFLQNLHAICTHGLYTLGKLLVLIVSIISLGVFALLVFFVCYGWWRH